MNIFGNIFGSKGKKELKQILFELQANLENNYKDSAHSQRLKLKERAEALYAEGRIDARCYKKYLRIYEEYTEKMKNYKH